MEIQEAKQILIDNAFIIGRENEEISIAESIGRVIAEDIKSPFAVPSFPKSAMDGYAVKAKEVEGASKNSAVRLKVVGEMLAGDYKETEWISGTAVRIMTGAYVPKGYDAVVKQEDTDYGEDTVLVMNSVAPFTNYCKVGEDIEEGEIVITGGTILTRAHVGMLASLGIAEVKVKPQPVIGIICTGSELLSVNDSPVKGKIYNSISYMLAASLKKAGLICKTVICKDDADIIQRNITEMLGSCDAIITTGGVSVGKKDLLPEVIESIGAKVLFKRVNIKPGTPTTASVKDGKVILSLSGNPYAALCNFDYYFWDLLAHITENDTWASKIDVGILADDYGKIEKTKRFLRARFENGVVHLEKKNASSVISNLNQCNCYVIIDANKEYKKNHEVNILMMKD